MAFQHNVYNHLDNDDPATCWQYNDQLRNDMLDKEGVYGDTYDDAERNYCAKVKAECRALWEISKKRIQHNVTNPMPITLSPKPTTKICWRAGCQNEVSWEWGDGKNWCCGDQCVDTLMPNASHFMKMNCICMELKRYWERVEKELDEIAALEAVSTPDTWPNVDFSFGSPTSVHDIEQDGMFSMDDIMPLDLNETDLYCYESLSNELKDLGCDDLLL